MPTQLTIPTKPSFGVGTFEPYQTFHGAAGLRWAWESSFGGVLFPTFDEAFTPLAGGGSIGVLPTPSGTGFFAAAGNITLHHITKAMTNTQHAAASHYVQQSFLFDGFATAIRNAAETQLHTAKTVTRKTAPRPIIRVVMPTVRVNLKPLQAAVRKANARAGAAEKENAHLRKRVQKLEHTIAQPAPVPWPGIPGEIDRIWGAIGRLGGKLRNPSKLLGLAAFLALLAKALPKLGVNYIRCRENKRWGAHVCRNGYDFLSNLIAATSLIVGIWSLLDFAKTMQAGVSDVVTATKTFWGVTDRVLGAVLAEADPTINMDWRVS